jgi:hypothetical protein
VNEGWGILWSFLTGCLGWAAARWIERVWSQRRPPRDTAEYLNRLASIAHPLLEARLTAAWHEAELAKEVQNVPVVFEDQIMLAAQLGNSIEQSVMREVQRQGIPIVRLSGDRAVGYSGWMSRWLRREGDPAASAADPVTVPRNAPFISVPDDPQLPAHVPDRVAGHITIPPPSAATRSHPTTDMPELVFRDGGWFPPKRG